MNSHLIARRFGPAAAVTLAALFGPVDVRAETVIHGPGTQGSIASGERTQPIVTSGARPAASDSADVITAVARFHAALASGDTAAVLALLSDDVDILESGGVETKAGYRAGHLNSDIAYAQAVPSQRSVTSVRIRGDVAWVTSSSTTQGEFRGRQVNSAGAELMVLSREGATWKIRAIHWSSRARRA